jgi:hypothetical protein
LKSVVSAGALHPTKCVIIGQRHSPIAYNDTCDEFLSVRVRDIASIDAFLAICHSVLPEADGDWLALIVDIRDLSTVYSNCASLLWRDAGAIIQAMALVAESHNMAFCPLGILGQEIVSALLPNTHYYVPVGVAALGLEKR